MLFNSLPFQRGTDPQTATMAYLEALRGVSVEAVTEGVRKFLRGDCDGISTKFVPTPPELARIVRTAAIPAQQPIRRVETPRAQSHAERGRMALKMALLKAAFGTERMADVERATKAGFGESIGLAQSWGLPIAPETWAEFEAPGSEDEWQAARRRAHMEIERNPPPYLRRQRQEAR